MLRLTIPNGTPLPGPIADSRTARTCTHAGVGLVQGKLVTFKEVEKGLVATEAELTRSMEQKGVIDTWVLGLKWTKAACDGFIAISSEFAGPKGKAIAGVYKITSSVAEAASSTAAGQAVNWTKTTTGVATGALKSASGLAAAGKLPLSPAARMDLADIEKTAGIGKISVEIVHSAMKQDPAGIAKQFYELSAEVSTMSLEYMEKEKATKVVKIGKALIDTGLSMYESYDEFRRERAANQETVRSMKRTLSNQLASVRQKIRQLEQEFATCGPPLVQP